VQCATDMPSSRPSISVGLLVDHADASSVQSFSLVQRFGARTSWPKYWSSQWGIFTLHCDSPDVVCRLRTCHWQCATKYQI